MVVVEGKEEGNGGGRMGCTEVNCMVRLKLHASGSATISRTLLGFVALVLWKHSTRHKSEISQAFQFNTATKGSCAERSA
jgi:hypothetical protein